MKSTTLVSARGLPIGESLPTWKAATPPPRTPIEGRYARIKPLDPDVHAAALWSALSEDKDGSTYTYMSYAPFVNLVEYRAWMLLTCGGDDPLFYAIIDRKTGKPCGTASHLRIDPRNGSIEVGNIHYAPCLQQTRAATEAQYLLMRRVFRELGYRRYEWKCDALNEKSRRAATRFGFTYEGTFRQALVYKNRNRDTAWYAMIDKEWPRLEAAYEAWLDPGNFYEEDGQQRRPLGALTADALTPLRA